MKKFTISRNDLFASIQKVIGVIERRQTLPILANVFMVLDQGVLTMTGTDLEVQVTTQTKVTSGDDMRITVPGRKLLDICRTLTDDAELTLSFSDQRLTLRSGKSRFTLSTLPASEFPVVDKIKSAQKFSLPQQELHVLDNGNGAKACQGDG